ncbi:RNA polymerase sigma-70 factor [Pseudoflavitalea sp. G-6-1-2]|uniref:RNA polymerase sigma-70 factor n=1 Tax=Pseudoflavitalea sp. G-6-1-2 TaxID=2728841 RepID=UPI001981BE76|nr:RNA polymerase sigma-70 factor [Pseudoflavitalea sp. G-6-1-2]
MLLTEQLRNGDMDAFNTIYFRYSEMMYRYALHILQNDEECTDAVQDIFVWLWTNREKLNISNLKGYLLAAIKYKLSRIIVSSKRKEAILSSHPIAINTLSTGEDLEIKQLRETIADFIKTLPPRAREIYQLSREQYFSNKEIAARLGISEKTVEAQMTISLKKLKLHLGKMSFWSVFL